MSEKIIWLSFWLSLVSIVWTILKGNPPLMKAVTHLKLA